VQSMQEMYDAAATRDAQHAKAGRGRGLSLRAATVINIAILLLPWKSQTYAAAHHGI
jgi:hypothetical protein